MVGGGVGWREETDYRCIQGQFWMGDTRLLALDWQDGLQAQIIECGSSKEMTGVQGRERGR